MTYLYASIGVVVVSPLSSILLLPPSIPGFTVFMVLTGRFAPFASDPAYQPTAITSRHPPLSPLNQADAVYDPTAGGCAITTTEKNRDNVIATLVSDIVLCGIMLVGVARQKNDGGLWRMILRHGVIWIVLATLSEVPPATFLILDLNGEFFGEHRVWVGGIGINDNGLV